MTLPEFKASLKNAAPEKNWNPLLQALWYDGRNDWESAHNLAQEVHTNEGSWIHAYLHRKEGDQGNAAYWYHRAGKRMPNCSLDEEWETLVVDFLK